MEEIGSVRIHHLAVAAAAGVAVFAGAAPAFAGVGMGQVLVSPSTVTTGQIVHITGTCPNNGGSLQWVGSPAFAKRDMDDPYTSMTGHGGSATLTSTNPMKWAGWAKISKTAHPGTNWVEARCGATTIKVQVVVVVRTTHTTKPMMTTTPRPTWSASSSTGMTTMSTATATPTAAGGQVGMMPSGAPDTGLASSTVPGGYTTELAGGGALFAAGIAGLLLRRRARARR